MLVLAFTDAELKQIAEESPAFAQKLAHSAGVFRVQPKAEAPLEEYFQSIYPKHGLTTCVHLVRAWAQKAGIAKYSSLAGAKRIVDELRKKQEAR